MSGEQDDNGFTPEEQAQFDQMRSVDVPGGAVADPDPAPDAGAGADAGAGDAPADGAQPDAAAQAAAAAAAGADDDDEGEDDAGAGADQPQAGADGQPGAGKKPRRVSRGKYEAAEAERVRLAGELEKERAKQARLDERLQIINEALNTPPQQAQQPEVDADPEPELDADGSPVDIFKYAAWQRREMKRMNDRFQGMQQQTQQRDQQQTIEGTYRSDVDRFKAAEPNWDAAYEHLMGARILGLALFHFNKDLTEDGATLSPQEQKTIANAILGEERALVSKAIASGRSPAQMVYRMSKSLGFQPKAKAAAPDPKAAAAAAANGGAPPAARPNGQQPPARAAAPAAASAVEDIARINGGQEAALSLSNGGGAPGRTLTAEVLANMTDDEFAAYAEELSPQQWQKVMGG